MKGVVLYNETLPKNHEQRAQREIENSWLRTTLVSSSQGIHKEARPGEEDNWEARSRHAQRDCLLAHRDGQTPPNVKTKHSIQHPRWLSQAPVHFPRGGRRTCQRLHHPSTCACAASSTRPPSVSRCAPPSAPPICWDLPRATCRAARPASPSSRGLHRPYFTPAQRFRILEMRSLLAWSAGGSSRIPQC